MAMCFAGTVSSQTTVNLCGLVTDQSGLPLANTLIRLGQTTYDSGWGASPYLVTTDANGRYHLGSGICNVKNIIPQNQLTGGNAFSQPSYIGGKVLFSLPAGNSVVKMGLYDLSGRFVREVMNKSLAKGNYSVGINSRGISSQFYLLRVTINGTASVIKIQPTLHLSGGDVVQSAPEYQTRLQKLAAVVDTLHATAPGYTIGVTPIEALEGQHDFVLTKNHTWNGDTAGFWGDTSTYPKSGVYYVVLNRTNGAFSNDKIYWSNGMGGTKVQLSQQTQFKLPNAGGRFYIWVAPTDSNNRYFDFLEHNSNGTSSWLGNTTRVDGWRLPIVFRVHRTTGADIIMGDDYLTFYQSRQSKYDEYKNEVPKEFTGLATHDFANIWAPHTSPVNYFGTNGPYVNYFLAYEDSVKAHNSDAPAPTTTTGIFACNNGGMGSSPAYSAAVNRHVGHIPHGTNNANWRNASLFYKAGPANFFSMWSHRRCIDNKSYGFPYDDFAEQAAYVGASNVLWVAVAIGW